MEDSPRAPGPSRPMLFAAGALLALLLGAAYGPTLAWLWGRWQTDPFYSHGPLVPLVTLFLLWSRRARLRLDPGITPLAIAALASAALLHLLGVRLLFEFLSCLSLIAALTALALLAGGRPLLNEAAFPLAYLLFAVPLPIILLQQVSLPLQLFSSAGARSVLAGLGCPVQRQGVLLAFPKFTLAVADACSGLRSLLTVLAIGTLAAHLARASLARKTLLVALSSAAALLVNVLRITLAGLIGIAFDGETACLIFEKYSGYFFFALVVLSTLAVFKALIPTPPDEPAPAPPPPAPLGAARLATKILAPLLATLLPMAGIAMVLKAQRSSASPGRFAGWQPSVEGWEVVDVRPRAAFAGEEQITGLLRDGRGRILRFSLLHSVSGRYLHSPEACSVAAGWIPEQQLRSRDGSIQRWILRRGTERACVFFWFDLAGRPRSGSLDQHAGALVQRLWHGSIDSAYGEISFPLPPGASPEGAGLPELAQSLHEAVLQRLWPER
ncbi:MAG TPA: exosortase/archaeosortase family protein [Planctomycetota bacterium]|nr:exosortase/archaeosortase family protein [Planctomycetota bacterium]